MNKPFIEIDAEHFTLSAFETKPIEGYEVPTNKETGELFPNCCQFHKNVFESAEKWFEKFPNCCEPHKKLAGKSWFKKENYNGIAEKIVKQLSYTEHHISERINIDEWYKDITDYIEYNVLSFGHPAIGLHLYLGNLKHYIEYTYSEIPKDKRQRLIEFIETYYNSTGETNKTDLNILYSTYQKWLKTFPFDISFFTELKPHFEKQLPIINGKPETNKYTGFAKVKMCTKGSLIDVLLNLTKTLLEKVNVPELRKQGAITDIQANQLEFADAELNTINAEITKQYSKGELRYIKALKKWLKAQQNYFNKVAPILKDLPPQQSKKPKPELNKALISFSNPEIITSIHNELKGYFQGNEAKLKKALKGEQLTEFLLFPHNQNKFVEVFKRLKYNGFLLSTPKEIKDWICSTFTYQYQKGNKKEVREFNTLTVHDILTKDKGEPTKKERICNVDWLPYKSHLTRQREAEKEKI